MLVWVAMGLKLMWGIHKAEAKWKETQGKWEEVSPEQRVELDLPDGISDERAREIRNYLENNVATLVHWT